MLPLTSLRLLSRRKIRTQQCDHNTRQGPVRLRLCTSRSCRAHIRSTSCLDRHRIIANRRNYPRSTLNQESCQDDSSPQFYTHYKSASVSKLSQDQASSQGVACPTTNSARTWIGEDSHPKRAFAEQLGRLGPGWSTEDHKVLTAFAYTLKYVQDGRGGRYCLQRVSVCSNVGRIAETISKAIMDPL